MEVASGRSVALPVPSPSQPPRKEWRAVPEHSFRSSSSEETDHTKLGQSEERTIYEAVSGPLSGDYCSITINDGSGLNEDVAARQRIHDISRQRMELQKIEIELKARVIARSGILEVQDRYEAHLKESSNEVIELKDQLQKRQHEVNDLQQKIDEKERELRALKIDNEAAWAKEDMLREQNKELATFRRDRDNWETERSRFLKQIHDFQDHIHEKENRCHEMEEQNRISQETILYKDEQLREAQSWMARVQMDALQSTANQSLQTELRERTEQFNQCWGGLVRQYTDMERHLLQVIQQLQLEMASTRDQNGIFNEESKVAHSNSKDMPTFAHNIRDHFNGHGKGIHKNEHIAGIPICPSSVLGMGTPIPPSQMNTLHPLLMHQSTLHSIAPADAHIPGAQLSHFQQISTISSNKNRLSHQAESAASLVPDQNQQFPSSQAEQSLAQSDSQYSSDQSCDRQISDSDYPVPASAPGGSNAEMQTVTEKLFECNGKLHVVPQESSQISSDNFQFNCSSETKLPEPNHDEKVFDEISSSPTDDLKNLSSMSEQAHLAANATVSDIFTNSVISSDAPESDDTASVMSGSSGSDARFSNSLASVKTLAPVMLDEKSLLACIVRAVPASSAAPIRISTTLPNRLAKMLKPLNWHDYKKHYGKLDDFVARHPELFVIKEDFIHLREGAQEIVSANTAAAKFAAATAVSTPYLSRSVVVTPVAQGHRFIKRCQPTDGESSKIISNANACNMNASANVKSNGQPNSSSFNIIQCHSDVKILRKKDVFEKVNGLSSEIPRHSATPVSSMKGNIVDEGLSTARIKGVGNAMHGNGLRQQGRLAGAGFPIR